MMDKLWLLVVVAVLMGGIACWPQIGFSQEHFLSEKTYQYRVEARAHNKGRPGEGQVTVLGLTLNKHTAEDAMRKLGKADPVVAHISHSDPYICYRSDAQGDETILTLSYESDSQRRFLTQFQIIAGSEKFKSRDRCARTSLVSKALSTESGIALGIAPSKAKAILAIETEERGEYVLSGSTYYEDVIGCNKMKWMINARFRQARLTWLQIAILGEMIRETPCTEEERKLSH